MTEKLATRPGMKLAKIGGLLIAATIVLILAMWFLNSGFGPAALFFFFLIGAGTGTVLVIIGFIKRLFGALEKS